MVKGISIVLCTFNGAARLRPTIEHLAEQERSCDAELVLVDNASSDGSASMVEDIWHQNGDPYPLVIVHESEPGLIHARKAGLQAARYEIVIFCDDDNWLQQDYLKLTQELFDSIPGIGLLGGQGIGVTDGEFPAWWEEANHSCNYAVGRQLPRSGFADSRGYLWGAGLAGFKGLFTHIFDDAYPFLMVGRIGKTVLSGDDSEMCLRTLLVGSHLYYDERLVYRHYIPSSRLTDAYFQHLIESFSASAEIGEEYRSALYYSHLSKKEVLRLFFVRSINALLYPNNTRKCRMFRQFLSYACKIRRFVPQKYKVIYDFGKFSHWGKKGYEA